MERLQMINVISVPHMKKPDAKKVIRDLQRMLDTEKPDAETIKRNRQLLLDKLRGKSF